MKIQSGLISNTILTDQKTNFELLEHQLNEAEKAPEILKDNNLNKQRLTKLGEWSMIDIVRIEIY